MSGAPIQRHVVGDLQKTEDRSGLQVVRCGAVEESIVADDVVGRDELTRFDRDARLDDLLDRRARRCVVILQDHGPRRRARVVEVQVRPPVGVRLGVLDAADARDVVRDQRPGRVVDARRRVGDLHEVVVAFVEHRGVRLELARGAARPEDVALRRVRREELGVVDAGLAVRGNREVLARDLGAVLAEDVDVEAAALARGVEERDVETIERVVTQADERLARGQRDRLGAGLAERPRDDRGKRRAERGALRREVHARRRDRHFVAAVEAGEEDALAGAVPIEDIRIADDVDARPGLCRRRGGSYRAS